MRVAALAYLICARDRIRDNVLPLTGETLTHAASEVESMMLLMLRAAKTCCSAFLMDRNCVASAVERSAKLNRVTTSAIVATRDELFVGAHTWVRTAIDRTINRASLPGMSKLPISIAVTAAMLSVAACDRNKIKREAEDVQEAREEVQEEQREEDREVGEAKAELQEEQAELSLEVQKQINDLEERYLEIEKDAVSATQRLEAEGTRAQDISEIDQAKTLARTRIDDARKAKTASEATQALEAAEDALDAFERKVDHHGGNV